MGPERHFNLHKRLGELEQLRDTNLPLLYFPLLFPHAELGCQLQVRYQDDVTSHNNNRISCRILPHTDFESRPVGTHCILVLKIVSVPRFHTNYLNTCD